MNEFAASKCSVERAKPSRGNGVFTFNGQTTGLGLSIWYVAGLLTHHWEFGNALYLIYVPAAMWIVASFLPTNSSRRASTQR